MRDAVAELPPDIQHTIAARVREAPHEGPLTCPMLDRGRGACLVYAARPVACRTYGFYTERDGGLHCDRVTRAVETNAGEAPVLWGNGEAIGDDMKALGEIASLAEWMDR